MSDLRLGLRQNLWRFSLLALVNGFVGAKDAFGDTPEHGRIGGAEQTDLYQSFRSVRQRSSRARNRWG